MPTPSRLKATVHERTQGPCNDGDLTAPGSLYELRAQALIHSAADLDSAAEMQPHRSIYALAGQGHASIIMQKRMRQYFAPGYRLTASRARALAQTFGVWRSSSQRARPLVVASFRCQSVSWSVFQARAGGCSSAQPPVASTTVTIVFPHMFGFLV